MRKTIGDKGVPLRRYILSVKEPPPYYPVYNPPNHFVPDIPWVVGTSLRFGLIFRSVSCPFPAKRWLATATCGRGLEPPTWLL